MSNPGYGYQGYGLDQTGQDQEGNLQARQRLIQGMMQPSQNAAQSPWGGLANAGGAIAGALAQRGMQGQQNQILQNQWARDNPQSIQTDSGPVNIPRAQLPMQRPALSSWLGSAFSGGAP